jgi:hypothetical protein
MGCDRLKPETAGWPSASGCTPLTSFMGASIMSNPFKPEPKAVKELRDNLGCGLIDAYNMVLGENLERGISEAKTVEDLKPILTILVRRTISNKPI